LITGFWYNPNIWPREEYEKRKESLVKYEAEKGMAVMYDDSWKAELNSGPSFKRCPLCYEERLAKTAQTAGNLNFDFFTTTLLVSPYQKHRLIINLAEEISREFGVNFYYEDFRHFFYSYRKEAHKLGLYHQKYCGCKPSIKEAEETRKRQKIAGEKKFSGS